MKFKSILLTAAAMLGFTAATMAQNWYPKQSLPGSGRGAAAGFSIGPIGYIVGGETANGAVKDFWRYNSINNSWTLLAPFPGNLRVKAVGFELNGLGYYGLGSDSTFYKYDPNSAIWTQLSSPTFGLSYWSSMCFTSGNDAYFLFASSNVFVKYNTITNTWSQLRNFPGPIRFTGSGFSILNKGYIACGVNSFGNPYLNDLWEYDISRDTWQTKAPLPATGRYATFALDNNGKGYLLGGERFSPNNALDEFWEYNPLTDNWNMLAAYPGGPRNYISGFKIGNNIYAGFGGFGFNKNFFMYGCANNLSATPMTNTIQIGSSASFTASTSDTNPSYIWQSNFGQGFQTLNNFGNYSGTSTNTVSISNVQLSNHMEPIRAISVSGNCRDTSNIAYIKITDTCITKVTKYDTITTKITKYDTIKVMDTLVINATLSGISAPNNTNRIIVYPNPAKDHITIDYGIFSRMSGYTVKITNTLGQTVFSSPINQQSSFINLSTWTGKGVYYLQIMDPSSNMIENRKIVLQ